MAQSDLNLQLMLTLNDQASSGLRRMMKDMQDGAQNTARSMQDIDKAAQKAGSNRMSGLLDAMRSLGREAANVLNTITRIGAGVAAGSYAVARMAAPSMEYDRRLALMANTAFAGRDTQGRISGKSELDAAIQAAVRMGGGTRESAAETLDKMLASGAISAGSASKLLPTLMRASTATGASAGDLADIAIRAKQTFGLSDEDLPSALDKAITAGQAGGFELRDMARWLPQQMAAARLSGLTGMGGLQTLLAYNQAAAITAGTKDEAGNNLVNLLAKINSRDTSRDAEKEGIDLSGTLAAARAKGINGLDAFLGIADKIAAGDSAYVKLRAQAAGETGDERKATLQAMGDILQGSAIGKIIQDRQALMALVGAMNNREYMAGIEQRMQSAGGETLRSFGTVADTTSFALQQAKTEKDIAAQRIFDAAAPTSLLSGLSNAAREFPNLTTAVVGTTGAMIALTTALGASGLLGMITGKGAAGAAGAKVAATAAAGRVATATAAGASLGVPVAVGAGAGWAVYEAIQAYKRTEESHAAYLADKKEREERRQKIDKILFDYGGQNLLTATKNYDFAELHKVLAGIEHALKTQKVEVQIDGKTVAESTNKANAAEARRR